MKKIEVDLDEVDAGVLEAFARLNNIPVEEAARRILCGTIERMVDGLLDEDEEKRQ